MKLFYSAIVSLSLSAFFGLSSHAQNITTLAGSGVAGFAGDGGPASAAKLNNPYGVAADTAGNVYITDCDNNRIRKVARNGIISTIAGTGTSGYSGDGGQATAAKITLPRGITIDPAGNIVFSDRGNCAIRKINLSTGVITTIAGSGTPGFSGDGGAATNAKLYFPWGVAYDRAGNLFIADDQNCRIRMVNTSGNISTICGTGSCFIAGDGGLASAAKVQYPVGVAVDQLTGSLYIADDGNNRVREIKTTNIISTIAGSPTYGFSGDGGPSTASKLYYPKGVATDDSGRVLIADQNNNRIRRIDTFHNIYTIIGNGTPGYSGDNGPATAASLNQPTGMCVASRFGKIYVADNQNQRIRVVDNFHVPKFTAGDVIYSSACNTDTLDLSLLFAVMDSDAAQTLNWYVTGSGPAHGVLNASYSTISTGSIVIASGVYYVPTTGFTGTDSFNVVIFDGNYYDTSRFVISVNNVASAGTISGRDSVCIGDTVHLSSTVTGGSWFTNDTSKATIGTFTGVVTARGTGLDTIRYVINNACGSDVGYYTIYVKYDTGDCKTLVGGVAEQTYAISILPNPNDGSFTVTAQSVTNGEMLVTVYDMLGNKVFACQAPANRPCPVALGQPSGTYLVRVSNGRVHYSSRVIIAK
ncbi:MAG: T9SS C-terminal target domain-containing protein [Chitinophagia bacterium]|nr:T9SS C-terminal target domain-containing protein [Chitinophagia bacterium]